MINKRKPTTQRAVEIDGIGRIQRTLRTNGCFVGTMYSKGWNDKTGMTGWTFDINEADRFAYKKAERLVHKAYHPKQINGRPAPVSWYPPIGNIVGG